MTSILSRREAQRNEAALQQLLLQPHLGNNSCADCAARNPTWASWNIGVFLCMRCASIHRKMGTHVSKVKSLSMDKWTSEQIDSMRQAGGNIAVNKVYNPKNKRPDMPLDADEVDGAMERFIRKKYQEKSLASADGRPQVPAGPRPTTGEARAREDEPLEESVEEPAQNHAAGKKHKFFGFTLKTGGKSRKGDREVPPSPYKITPIEYSPATGETREISDRDLDQKVQQLKEMGFPDTDRNAAFLVRSGGDVERAVNMLVRQGPTPDSAQSDSRRQRQVSRPAASSTTAASSSEDPFSQLDARESQPGLSLQQPQQPPQPAPVPNANPWQTAMPSQSTTSLTQQFTSMNLQQPGPNPLFPNATGGYNGYTPTQQTIPMQSMVPSVPQIPQQYSGYTASPTLGSNPFFQQQQAALPMSSQSTGTNPFMTQHQPQAFASPQPLQQQNTNPFFSQQQQMPAQQNRSVSVPLPASNPFGLPPSSSPPMQQQTQQTQQSFNPFGVPQQSPPPQPQPQQAYMQAPQNMQPIQQPQQFSPQPQTHNPFFTQPSQAQAQAQAQAFPYQPQQPQQLVPQQTGRLAKNDIMALFNTPYQPPQQQLASIGEMNEQQSQTQQGQQHDPFQFNNQIQPNQPGYTSPAPTNNPYGASAVMQQKRSATMPQMHSSGGAGLAPQTMSRNPFLSNTPSRQSSVASQGQQYGGNQFVGMRHASNESMSVNNPMLVEGRHSPDAFASLSSGYGR